MNAERKFLKKILKIILENFNQYNENQCIVLFNSDYYLKFKEKDRTKQY